MSWIENCVPMSIILCLMGGIICSAIKGETARKLTIVLISVVAVMNAFVLGYTVKLGHEFVYVMGRFPAPWGNELRAGCLEGLMALFFSVIMLLSVVGGIRGQNDDIRASRMNLYFIMINLMMSSLMALVYTNDLFTAYVFVEINTMAACALIMIRDNGHTLVAATKYMIMSLLGSGLLLIGISMLYTITGQLLMPNIREAVTALAQSGEYEIPLTVIIGACHQECTVSFPQLAARGIRFLDRIIGCDTFVIGQQRLYLPAYQDILPCYRNAGYGGA